MGHPAQGHPRFARGAVAATFLLLLGWTVEAAIDQEALELVWYDDFEGSSVDWDKWIVDKGDGCDVGLCDWGNGEEQYYLTENAQVADGLLEITAKKETYSSRFYTSSKLISRNKYAFRYGKAEARIKLPPSGEGLWPAFWMMPQDNAYGAWAASGEIDILESRNNITEVINNLNFGNAFPENENYNGECLQKFDVGMLQEFHTYAVEWDEDEFVWYMDGVETCRQNEWYSTDVKTGESRPQPAPFDQAFYLVLNVAVGGNKYFVGEGPINDTALPASMLVDWVRVYQTPEQYGEGPTSAYLGDAVGGGSRQGLLVWSGNNGSSSNGNGSEPSEEWETASGQVCLGATSLCSAEIQECDENAVAFGDGAQGALMSLTAEGGADEASSLTSATSGLSHTEDTFSFTYGRVEANLSAPSVAGVVSTVSLLTMHSSTTGQVEVVAFENGIASGGVWYPDEEPETTTPFTCQAPPPMGGAENDAYDSSTFYEFAVEWTDDRFRWYAGGRQYCEITRLQVFEAGGAWPFNDDMYASVGLSVGRDLNGSSVAVNGTSLPVTLTVASVRAYQFMDMKDAPVQESATKYEREGNLTWQDEFDGLELDEWAAEEAGEGILGLEYWWQHEEGDGCEMGICGFGNGEAQWYRKENTGIRDGKLIVTAKAEPYAGNIYTSAKLSTDSTVVVSYGRIEVRAKLPSAQGLWPSIWMLPQDSPYGGWASGGAIDILQARNQMTRVHGQLVFGGEFPDVENLDLYQGGHCFSDLVEDFSEDYHVYAVEWEVDSIRWYVDGVLYCDRDYWYSRPGPEEDDYPFPAPFDTGFYIIINIAVGGGFTGGPIDEDALGESPAMLVDYVRVYTLEGQSVWVADPPEDTSSRGGQAVTAVTALSVLVVLFALLGLCVVVNCVAKRKTRKAAREREHLADNTGGLPGDGNFDESDYGHGSNATTMSTLNRYSLHRHDSNGSAPSGVKATTGLASSKAAFDKSHGKPYLARVGSGGAGGGIGGTGTVSTTPQGTVGNSFGAGDGARSPPALWARGLSANDNRKDVTPGRLSQTGSDVFLSNGSKKCRPRLGPRPPSGVIPEDWEVHEGPVESTESGLRPRSSSVDRSSSVNGNGIVGDGVHDNGSKNGNISSIGGSNVDVNFARNHFGAAAPLTGLMSAADAAAASAAANAAALGSRRSSRDQIYDYDDSADDVGRDRASTFGSSLDDDLSDVDSSRNGWDHYGSDFGRRRSGSVGGGGGGGVSAGSADYGSSVGFGNGGRGSDDLLRARPARAERTIGGRTNSFTRSASVCSDESEMKPPTMAELRLDDATVRDGGKDVEKFKLPSYEQATAAKGMAIV